MNPLYIVLLVCPFHAATPEDCVVGFEKPLVSYDGLEECTARAEELYQKSARELYKAGAAMKINCVNKDVLEHIKRKAVEGKFI